MDAPYLYMHRDVGVAEAVSAQAHAFTPVCTAFSFLRIYVTFPPDAGRPR